MIYVKRHLALLSLLLGLVLGMTMASPALVAAQDDAEDDEPTAASQCLDRFGTFMSSLLSFDAFQDYWEDIFRRNRCQQDDIFSLDDEVENRMKELREEYIDHCTSDEIYSLQDEIRELKMEIHFVRYIVPIHEDTNYKQDTDAYEANFTNIKSSLLSDMVAKYVRTKDWLGEDELEELFNGWVEDYEDRIPKYQDCNESPWQEVADKWEEFTEKLSLIKSAQTIGERAQEIKEEYEKEKQERNEAANIKAGGAKEGNITSFKGFLAKHIDIRVKGIDKLKTGEDILEEAAEEGEVLTAESTLTQIAEAEERYTRDTLRAEMIGTFDLRYKEGTAEISNDLTYRIQELSAIIVNTTENPVFLPGLRDAAKKVHKKQGSGTP